MRRYITYKRVSSQEQGRSGLGLEAQERDIQLFLENYADSPYEVVGEFVEVHSGSDNDRPQLTSAIAQAKKENAAGGGADRLSRNLYRIADGREGIGVQSRPDALCRRVSTPHLCGFGRAGTTVHLPADYIGTEVSKGAWCSPWSPDPSHRCTGGCKEGESLERCREGGRCDRAFKGVWSVSEEDL